MTGRVCGSHKRDYKFGSEILKIKYLLKDVSIDGK
jgi:hypothetical protein